MNRFSVAGAGRSVQERPWQRLPQILIGSLIALYIIFFVVRVLSGLFSVTPSGSLEASVFDHARQLFRYNFDPNWLYTPNNIPPVQEVRYPPLFYYLHALTMFVTGETALWGGRLLTLLSSIYLGVTLYRVARREELVTGRPAGYAISAAAALTPFGTLALYNAGTLATPDVLAVALSFGAAAQIWIGDLNRRKQPTGGFVLAGILCALALLTSGASVAATLAIFLFLGLNLRWRDVGLFLAGLLPLLLVAGVGLQFATGGNFWQHLFGYNSFGFNFLTAEWSYFFLNHFILLGLALFWLVRPFIQRFERPDLWRYYFIVALLIALFFGRTPANFIEILALTSLLAWWQLGRLILRRPDFRLGSVRLSWVFIIMLAVLVQYLQLWHFPF
jgi:hypothetical protein